MEKVILPHAATFFFFPLATEINLPVETTGRFRVEQKAGAIKIVSFETSRNRTNSENVCQRGVHE